MSIKIILKAYVSSQNHVDLMHISTDRTLKLHFLQFKLKGKT